jgi:hypothetical protein
VFFVIRRIVFVFSAIYLRNFLFFQLATQFVSLWFSINYVFEYQPFDNKLTTILELMNEFTSGILMYHVIVFNPAWVSEDEPREFVGISFIVIVCMNISVHVFFLCKTSYTEASKKIKDWVYKCKRKKEEQAKKSINSPK